MIYLTYTEKAWFNAMVSATVKQFFEENKIEPFDINVEISNDFCKRYAEIRPELSDEIWKQKDSLCKAVGLTIPPKKYTDNFTVLIREDCASKLQNIDVGCLGVVVHEITHVCDFKDYSSLIGNKDYMELLIVEKHGMFLTWTEFHAELNKYLFLRQFYHDTLDDILNRILPAHTKYVSQGFDEGVLLNDKLYNLAHFLGRLYVWECQFPSFFTKQVTDKILTYEWVRKLYQFFKTHISIEKAHEEIAIMHNILKDALTPPVTL